jgi:hypothetical protein
MIFLEGFLSPRTAQFAGLMGLPPLIGAAGSG